MAGVGKFSLRRNLGRAKARPYIRQFAWRLFVPEDDFALADELVVEPEAIFVGGGFRAWPRRAAEQTNAGGRLEDVRGKRAAVHVEFDAQIAGVGEPGDLVAGIEYDDLRNESNEYGAFGHLRCAPQKERV